MGIPFSGSPRFFDGSASCTSHGLYFLTHLGDHLCQRTSPASRVTSLAAGFSALHCQCMCSKQRSRVEREGGCNGGPAGRLGEADVKWAVFFDHRPYFVTPWIYVRNRGIQDWQCSPTELLTIPILPFWVYNFVAHGTKGPVKHPARRTRIFMRRPLSAEYKSNGIQQGEGTGRKLTIQNANGF